MPAWLRSKRGMLSGSRMWSPGYAL
jgi:hypothetical protein